MLYLYLTPLIFSIFLGVILVLVILRNRINPSNRALSAVMLCAIVWSLGYTLEFLVPSFAAKVFWAKFQYFGIAPIPLAWLVFAFRYVGSRQWLDPPLRYRAALAVFPALMIGLVWTNELHHLVWPGIQVILVDDVQVMVFQHGPAFWALIVYSYSLLLFGSVKMVLGMLDSFYHHRRQIGLLLVATLIPWFGNLVYITGLNPLPELDWTPFSFIIAGMLFTISFFYFHLVDILPIAQQVVFAGQPDRLVVLDAQDCLVEMNQSARKRFVNTNRGFTGKPFPQIYPEITGWLARTPITETSNIEISEAEETDLRYYDLRITPLFGENPEPVGRLVVFHEITQHKKQQVLLEQAVFERTRELNQALDQMQNELTQRTLAEQRIAEVIESAPDGMILIDQTGGIMRYNAQAEALFGYLPNELLGQHFEVLMSPEFSPELHGYITAFIGDPACRQNSFGIALTARRKDGSAFPVEVSLGKLNTDDGFWVACSLRDITARIQAEEEQNRLLEEISRSHEQLRDLASRLQDVQEVERRQIAGELHDRVGQNLTALNLNLQVIQNLLKATDNPQATSRLADSLKLVEETTRVVRDVMAELHPLMLDKHGLVAALHSYAESYTRRTGIATYVMGDEYRPRLPRKEEIVIFRLVLEALTNIYKHAQAKEAVISLATAADRAVIMVKDDGKGFDPHATIKPGQVGRWGLVTMQQRADSIGAQLSIDSAPERGTTIFIHLRRHYNGH